MGRILAIAAAAGVVAAIVVAVVVVRGDGGSEESLGPWADEVCATLDEWRDSILSLADVSGEPLTADLLRERLAAAETASAELVSGLREIAPPESDAAAELDGTLDEAADGLQETYQSLRADAEAALEGASPESFLQALAGLAPRFQELLDQVRSVPEELAQVAGDVEQAFADAPSCAELADAG